MSFASIFTVYLVLVIGSVVAVAGNWLPRRASMLVFTVLLVWLAYAGILGFAGVVGHYDSLPPGIALLTGPIVLALLVLALSTPGRVVASNVPLWLLLGFQLYRTGVELSLHHLYSIGLAPKLMTLEGGNVEILVALTAPLAAWMVTRGSAARTFAWIWNLAGLFSLANIVVRAVLSAPGPLHLIHAEVPDTAILLFPFTFIPGFMAPLAFTLHVLAFRAFRKQGAAAKA